MNNNENNKKPSFLSNLIKKIFYKKKPVQQNENIEQNVQNVQPEQYEKIEVMPGVENTMPISIQNDSINSPEMSVAIEDNPPIEVQNQQQGPVVSMPEEGFGNPTINNSVNQSPVQFGDAPAPEQTFNINTTPEEYGKLAFGPDEQPVVGTIEQDDVRDHAADAIYGTPAQENTTVAFNDSPAQPVIEEQKIEPVGLPNEEGFSFPSVPDELKNDKDVVSTATGQDFQFAQPVPQELKTESFVSLPQEGFGNPTITNPAAQTPVQFGDASVAEQPTQENVGNIRIVSTNPNIPSNPTVPNNTPITPVTPVENGGIRLVNPNQGNVAQGPNLIFPNTDPEGLGEQDSSSDGRNPKM